MLQHYVKANELNKQDMVPYLKLLLTDVANKEIPKLCFEIMSSFFKQDKV